jgi:TPP-dependent pyruvate/acetoin dehydrogenase alpha subunit
MNIRDAVGDGESDAWREVLAPMLRARRFEEALIEHAALVDGVFHVGIWQEATAAGIALCRRPGDWLSLSHRNHHHLAAIGTDLEAMFREIFGRAGGPQRGRAGTLHLADPANGVPHTSAMVGGGVPIGLGLALAAKRRGSERIAICVFGDGAMGEGLLHESLNLASLWSLPALFVCESNALPSGPRANAFQAAGSLAGIAEAHRVAAAAVDATDVSATVAVLRASAADVRAGTGPRFVEARSLPWPGNAGFLPANPDGAVDLVAALGQPGGNGTRADPLLGYVRRLASYGVSPEAIGELDATIRAEVARAVEAAAAAPEPAPDDAFTDVWAAR